MTKEEAKIILDEVFKDTHYIELSDSSYTYFCNNENLYVSYRKEGKSINPTFFIFENSNNEGIMKNFLFRLKEEKFNTNLQENKHLDIL